MKNFLFFVIGWATLVQKEFLRLRKTAMQTLLSPLISVCLYLLIFGMHLAERIGEQNGINYLQFVIPGLAALGLLNNAFQNSSFSIINSKFHGDLQDLKVVPLIPSQIIWAYALGGAMRGILVSLAVVGVGELFYFIENEQFLPVYNGFLMLLFLFVGGLIFSMLGLSVSLYSNSFDQMTAVSTFVVLPLIYLGGVFFSVAHLPPFWKLLSYANPLFYLIDGIRYSFLGKSDIGLNLSSLVIFGFLIGAYLLARMAVKHGSYTRF